MTIQARFYVAEFNKRPANQGSRIATVVLRAVTRKPDEDNVDWSKFTPSGQIEMTVFETPGGAYEAFEELLGQDVSISIEPAQA